MTKDKKEDEKFEFPEEYDPIEEGVVPAEYEPDHPGWLSIADIMKISDPVFEKSVFIIGYQESSNVYVLAGDYLTIVDPGNDYTIFTELEKLGYDPLDIKKIVVTHGHRDHCMGVFELLRFPPIYESKDIEIINHEAGPLEFRKILSDNGFSLTQVKGGETLELSGFMVDNLDLFTFINRGKSQQFEYTHAVVTVPMSDHDLLNVQRIEP